MNNVEEIVLSLQQEIVEYKKENAYLRAEIAQLKRLIFGKKSERFISEEKPFPPGTLFSEVVPEENKLENLTEQISYERTKPVHRNGGAKNCRHIYFVKSKLLNQKIRKIQTDA
ncbi:MAG: transposase [Saprospiraceae bacterium]